MGVGVNLADYLDSSVLADFDQNALDYMTLDGSVYGLPLYISIQALGGNKEMLEAAGADVEKIQTEGGLSMSSLTLSKTVPPMIVSDSYSQTPVFNQRLCKYLRCIRRNYL